MQYYRRNPLELVTGGLSRSVTETVADLMPMQYVPDQAENRLAAAQSPIEDAADSIAAPIAEVPTQMATVPMQSPSELVQLAVDILDEEIAGGMLAARCADSPASALAMHVPPPSPDTGSILNSVSTALPLSAQGAMPNPFSNLLTLNSLPPTAPMAAKSPEAHPVVPDQTLPTRMNVLNTRMAEELLQNVQKLVTSFAHLLAENQQNTQLLTKVAYDMYGHNGAGENSVALLKPKRVLHAGETGIIALSVVNDSRQPVVARFQCTDLSDHNGYRIPGDRIGIDPHEVALAAGASVNVTLAVKIPLAMPSGAYSGLLTAPALPYLHAVVLVTVG